VIENEEIANVALSGTLAQWAVVINRLVAIAATVVEAHNQSETAVFGPNGVVTEDGSLALDTLMTPEKHSIIAAINSLYNDIANGTAFSVVLGSMSDVEIGAEGELTTIVSILNYLNARIGAVELIDGGAYNSVADAVTALQTAINTYSQAILQSQLGSHNVSPYESQQSFAIAKSGAPELIALIEGQDWVTLETDVDVGRTLVIFNDQIRTVATRNAVLVTDGAVFEYSATIKRTAEPYVSGVDTVEFGVELLNHNHISVGTLILGSENVELATGVFSFRKTFGKSEYADLLVDPSTVYCRPFISFVDEYQHTAIAHLGVNDVTFEASKPGKVAVPLTATSPGRVGDWAVDDDYSYFYTGDGTTHSWKRSIIATW
jgi:hypothetical protein